MKEIETERQKDREKRRERESQKVSTKKERKTQLWIEEKNLSHKWSKVFIWNKNRMSIHHKLSKTSSLGKQKLMTDKNN